MNSQSFSFAHPWALALLVLLPVLALLRGRKGAAPAVLFSSVEPLRALGRARAARAGAMRLLLPLVPLALFTIALARPQLGETIGHIEASGIDILLALDVSPSMKADDFTIGGFRATRLDAVKQVTEKFIAGRSSDRIGIVAFAGRPYLVSPLTLDHDWLLKNLERLTVGMVGDRTALGSAIASAANRLKDKPAKSKIIVLLTDGDNNAGKVEPNTAAEAAHLLGIKIYTICAGSTEPIVIQDSAGNLAQVAVDETALKEIARIGGGQFYRATNSKSLAQIFDQIDKLERSEIEVSEKRRYDDLFPWFVAAGAAVLGVGMVLGETVWRRVP